MKRLKFIDTMRGLAVAGMLMIRFFEWWLKPAAKQADLFAWLYFASKLVAPIFLFLVGVSLVLKIRRADEPTGLYGAVVSRGLKILSIGYLLNLAVWVPVRGLEALLIWDTLQLIGLSIVICLVLLEYTAYYVRLAVIVVILLEAPYILDHVFPGLPYYFSIIISGTAPLIYFPIIPWLIYIILGTVVGELFLKAQSQDNLENFLIPAALIGGALTVLGLFGRPYAVYFDPQELWQTEFSHPSLSQMVFAMGMLLLLFAGLCFLYQRRETVSALEPLEMMGRESFFIYIAHHPLGYSVFGLLDKHNAFGFAESTVMLLVTCILFYLFLRYLPGLTRRIHSIMD